MVQHAFVAPSSLRVILIFARDVRFHGLSDPVNFNQTANRGAKRRSELQTRFSKKKGVKKFQFFVLLIATWEN